MNSLYHLGEYILLMKKVFSIPERWNIFFKQVIDEINKLVINSIWIVVIISLFIGAVISMQVTLNIVSPLLPKYAVGFTTRETLLLEFSSSIMCLILAGKVGSNIASEIGSMRVTEQIDALDIIGVNSASYLILPKITSLVLFIPVLVSFSMIAGLIGGYLLASFSDMLSLSTYIYGIQYDFKIGYIWYSMKKSLVFAFIITSVSSYYGYSVKGGALDVGKASTNSVVMSSILILLADVVLTQLMLN
ncbi:MAG: ABC transporter permease [Candidatus Azobacteroides sp.]|nr:ABC transporter permease [Candidatus Azobacteroides sp.]